MNFDRNKVEMVKKQYPVGTRIRLNSLCNDERDDALNIALRANCRVSLDREAVAFCSAKVPENSWPVLDHDGRGRPAEPAHEVG